MSPFICIYQCHNIVECFCEVCWVFLLKEKWTKPLSLKETNFVWYESYKNLVNFFEWIDEGFNLQCLEDLNVSFFLEFCYLICPNKCQYQFVPLYLHISQSQFHMHMNPYVIIFLTFIYSHYGAKFVKFSLFHF